MKRVSDEIVLLPKLEIYNKPIGSFGVKKITNDIEWYTCRDLFHRHPRVLNYNFFFSHPKDGRENIAEFIDLIETKLKLKTKTRFHRTNVPTIMYVRPASFWTSYLRYSFFSILIRAGMNHVVGEGYEAALNSSEYFTKTRRAVDLFLSGRTRYVGYKGMMYGWVDTFSPIECCNRPKCIHKDRRCRKRLYSILVPNWQIFPIHNFIKLYNWIGNYVKNCSRLRHTR